MNSQQRVLTMQDLSCLGKCSAAAALPVLSVMGLECVLLPTAVLSAHTAFPGGTLHDLTGEIPGILEHWMQQALAFDGIYFGYLASQTQVQLAQSVIERFAAPGTRVVLDPVMGDHGRLYSGFTPERVAAMRRLCRAAGVLLPNLTEAALLLGRPYEAQPTAETVQALLRGLLELGAETVILTGVPGPEGSLGVAGLSKKGTPFTYFHRRAERSFSGTGDLFASVFTGGLLSGKTPEAAAVQAADFVLDCILRTLELPDARWYGVCFEPNLWRLAPAAAALLRTGENESR